MRYQTKAVRRKNHSINEEIVRHIVRQEIRKHLIEEGFFDKAKDLMGKAGKATGFIKDLSSKVKEKVSDISKKVMEKLKEFDAKIQEIKSQISAIKELQNGVRNAVKEGTGSEIEDLPEYKEAQKFVEFLSEPPPTPPKKSANESRVRSRQQVNLIERQLNNQIDILNEDFSRFRRKERAEILREAFLLNEGELISIGTVISIYAGIVTIFGLAQLAMKGCALFSKAMGYPDGHIEYYNKRAEAVHHMEQKFIKKTVLRPRVQYLIYKAYVGYKKSSKGIETVENPKGFSVEKAESARTFELFMKDQEAQEKAQKVGFIVIFALLVLKAFYQLGTAISKVFTGAGDVVGAIKPGVSTGVEGTGLAHAAHAAKAGGAAAAASAAKATKSIV